MKLPKKIKVGFLTYTISHMPKEFEEEHNCRGWCSSLNTQIYILTRGHSLTQIAETLHHEVLHAAYDMWGLITHRQKNTEEREEGIVNGFSLALATLWKDNPKTMQWIADHLKG